MYDAIQQVEARHSSGRNMHRTASEQIVQHALTSHIQQYRAVVAVKIKITRTGQYSPRMGSYAFYRPHPVHEGVPSTVSNLILCTG